MKEAALASFSLPARQGVSHQPWPHRVPAPQLPQVRSCSPLAAAKLAKPSQRPAPQGSPACGGAPAPGSSPLPQTVGSTRRGAGGRRSAATVTAAAGSRAEARAQGGRGCRAQRRPKGSRPPEAPVSAGADPRQPLHEPSKDGPWSLSARTRAWWGEARAHACLSGCASFSCTH